MNRPAATDVANSDPDEAIDRACLEFEKAWSHGLRPDIAEYLRSFSGDALRQSLPELLSVEWEQLRRTGVDPLLETYVERFAEFAHEIRSAWEEDAKRAAAVRFANEPRGGRYRILKSHARGGLGQVYVAHDDELGREVALKEIQPGQAHGEATRERFLREARITARLEHPGIVPVYGMGQNSDGTPFYAMRFVQGESLHAAIERFHSRFRCSSRLSLPSIREEHFAAKSTHRSVEHDTPMGESSRRDGGEVHLAPTVAERINRAVFRSVEFQQLLNRLIYVCYVIEFAHERGVVHRDLKPGNIMLGKHGETMVVDWGLAKETAIESDAEAESCSLRSSSEATSGSTVLGTPAYMSPEQAAGQPNDIGPASDIYSLGATLFHLLTGNSPLKDHSLESMLERIRVGEHSRPRGVLPEVPPALDAICEKAMSVRSADRYPSASALAGDLERWLADEPVAAYAEPLAARMTRWFRRHPALAKSIAASLLLLVVSLSSFAAILADKNIALARAETEERTAKQSAQEQSLAAKAHAQTAREQSQLAASTLNAVVLDLQKSFENVPGGAEVRQRLLLIALPRIGLLSSKFIAQSTISRNEMLTMRELADTILTLDQPTPTLKESSEQRSPVQLAAQLYRRAHDIAQQRFATSPQDIECRRDLATSKLRLGKLHVRLGRTVDALREYSEVLALRRSWLAENPENATLQRDVSDALDWLGDTQLVAGSTINATQCYEEAFRLAQNLAHAVPQDAIRQRDLAIAHNKMANVLIRNGQTAEAVEHYERGLAISRVLADRDALDVQRQRDLSYSYVKCGDGLMALGQPQAAFQHLEQALLIRRAMLAADPKNRDHHRDLSLVVSKLGDVCMALERLEDARQFYEEDLQANHALAADDPQDAERKRELSIAIDRLGDVCLKLGRLDDSLRYFQDGLAMSRALASADPSARNQNDVCISHRQVGDVLMALKRSQDALPHFESCLEITAALVTADPHDALQKRELNICHERLGEVCIQQLQLEKAAQHFEESLRLREALAQADPNSAVQQADLWIGHVKVGETAAMRENFSEAQQHFQAALRVLDQMIANGQSVDVSIRYREEVLAQVQFCEAAKLAGAEWEKFQEIDKRLWPSVLPIRALAMLKRGSLEGALRAVTELLELDSKDKNDFFNAGCIYVRCATFVSEKTDSAASESEIAERKKYLDLAMNCLRESIAAGFNDFDRLRTDMDLAPLRGRPDYEALFPRQLPPTSNAESTLDRSASEKLD